MVGEARLTAHGSGGGALVGGGAATDEGALEVPDAVDGFVACGVLATVESPEPHPANAVADARTNMAINGTAWREGDHTPGTVPGDRAHTRGRHGHGDGTL